MSQLKSQFPARDALQNLTYIALPSLAFTGLAAVFGNAAAATMPAVIAVPLTIAFGVQAGMRPVRYYARVWRSAIRRRRVAAARKRPLPVVGKPEYPGHVFIPVGGAAVMRITTPAFARR